MLFRIKTKLKENSYLSCLVLRYRLKKLQKFPPEKLIKKRFEKDLGYKLDLQNPKTYNEKIQWLKIYGDNNPVFGDSNLAKKLADKLAVRDYISQKIGKEYLKNIYGVYKKIRKINFSKLPDEFVLKTTHDSGSVLIVKDKKRIDKKQLKILDCSLKINYGLSQQEWVYNGIKPKIIAEELLKDELREVPLDFKVFCFQGEPKIIQVDLDRFKSHKRNFYDLNWKKLDLEIQYPNTDEDIEKIERLDEMLELSRILSQPFNHARVDWFYVNNRLYFGEITFFPESGFGKFNDKKWEYTLGSWIKL